MIVFCSARALSLIKSALAGYIGKEHPFPAIIDRKDAVGQVQQWTKEHPEAVPYLWNLDILDASATSGSLAGTYLTGYIYNAVLRSMVVTHGLSPQDLFNLDETIPSCIRSFWEELSIAPAAIERHLAACQEVAHSLMKDRHIGLEGADGFPGSQLILVANGNRKATAAINQARILLEQDPGLTRLERTDRLVDSYHSWIVASSIVTDKDAARGYVTPLEVTRRKVQDEAAGVSVPALTLRIELVDSYAEERRKGFWRDIEVPIDAPLSWLHHAIQRTMLWYDYHLHDFQLLSEPAEQALEDAFWSLAGPVQDFICPLAEQQEHRERFARGGAAGFEKATGLSPRWLYHDFLSSIEDSGSINPDCPEPFLPKTSALGCYFLGDAATRDLVYAVKEKRHPDLSSIPLSGPGLIYHYDYGDGWTLALTARDLSWKEAPALPRIADASGDTPPEDVGGLEGFDDFLKAMEIDGNNKDGIDLAKWSRGVGWQPFESTERLQGLFDAGLPRLFWF
ncbi:MAG: plasmid pRiA4b ORF-3 family protein [Atopobiaceae bacterium]|jgi:hypothetical protein|nr:plasmid pRiA4b ORF-3 family protein [Atopobiaceae bacterium]